jgi:RNA polymerase sigma-70 factor (family 1)
MQEFTDLELAKRMGEDDEHAFASLFERYQHKVFSIGMELTGSKLLAEDIVQDVFLNIWLKRSIIADVSHFRAYLFTTVRNIVVDVIRKKGSQERLAKASGQPLVGDTTFDALINKEYEQVLYTAIARLPRRQQEVYRLVRENGLKREEVAAMLNVSPETVKSNLSDALRNIRAYCKANLDILSFLLVCILLD